MLTKQELIKYFTKELATFSRVIANIPASGMSYKPDEKSRNAKDLALAIIGELGTLELFLSRDKALEMEEWKDVYAKVEPFEDGIGGAKILDEINEKFLSALNNIDESELEKPFNFYGDEGTRSSALLGMLFDTIHHRGQLAAYLRAAGGKVPSIYGPSADEVWE